LGVAVPWSRHTVRGPPGVGNPSMHTERSIQVHILLINLWGKKTQSHQPLEKKPQSHQPLKKNTIMDAHQHLKKKTQSRKLE
jgi:hypothetical protein